jgi:hypothetical protein
MKTIGREATHGIDTSRFLVVTFVFRHLTWTFCHSASLRPNVFEAPSVIPALFFPESKGVTGLQCQTSKRGAKTCHRHILIACPSTTLKER